MARRRSGSAPHDRAAATATRAGRPARTRASRPAASALAPFHVGAHAGAQLRHLFDRIGADRERPQVEIPGGAGGAPACVLALGRNELDLDGDAAVAERGNAHVEPLAELQRLYQVLAQIEVDPEIA